MIWCDLIWLKKLLRLAKLQQGSPANLRTPAFSYDRVAALRFLQRFAAIGEKVPQLHLDVPRPPNRTISRGHSLSCSRKSYQKRRILLIYLIGWRDRNLCGRKTSHWGNFNSCARNNTRCPVCTKCEGIFMTYWLHHGWRRARIAWIDWFLTQLKL